MCYSGLSCHVDVGGPRCDWGHTNMSTITTVTSGPKLRQRDKSGIMVLGQPGSVWMFVVLVTTSGCGVGHGRADTSNVGTGEVVLPLLIRLVRIA